MLDFGFYGCPDESADGYENHDLTPGSIYVIFEDDLNGLRSAINLLRCYD